MLYQFDGACWWKPNVGIVVVMVTLTTMIMPFLFFLTTWQEEHITRRLDGFHFFLSKDSSNFGTQVSIFSFS